jgi:cell division protein FtsW
VTATRRSRASTTAGRRKTGTSGSTRSARRRPAPRSARTRSAPVGLLGGVRPEAVLIVTVGLLCAIGLLMVYSASSVESVKVTGSTYSIVARQIVWFSIGCVVAFAVSRVPLTTMRRIAGPLMGLVLICLFLVVIPNNPLAQGANGATRWLGYGSLGFQPSELAKPVLVLWLAQLLATRQRDIADNTILKPILVIVGLMGALVLAGDDLGTTMLLGLIVLVMLLLAGSPLRTVATLAGVLAMVSVGALLFLEQFRVERLMAFLDPDKNSSAGYQVLQSQIGLASGGFFGSGPGYSRAKWGFLPEAHTDFILAVIGEEFGLVGTVLVISLFLVFAIAGCTIAMRRTDVFGRLVAFGITAWIGFQALINIGVAVGTLPTKGITLPFVSYGGSSLMMSLAGVGVLIAIARDS